MPTQAFNKVTVPAGDDLYNLTGDLRRLAESAGVIVPVASAAQRAAVVSEALAAGGGTLARPVAVWRTDLGRLEVTSDGTDWSMDGVSTYWMNLPAQTYTSAALIGQLDIPAAPFPRVAVVTMEVSAQNTSGAWYAALSDLQPNVSTAQRRAYFASSAGTTSSITRTLRIPIPAGQTSAARAGVAPAVPGQLTISPLVGANTLSAEVHPQGPTVAEVG